ncbi:alpha-L-arabinofuranosidase C-terminal domain-containing protein [Mariniflexile jejuense]|uniref:non-reducing end alpha-L-arabinofuranosidase n=1 Tax=Mariniflexile jejuense TaxID=1173582 RepID=A0ABW3JM40_9FLAO
MKLNQLILIVLCVFQIKFLKATNLTINPGQVYLFAYASNDGKSGLNFAWSIDEITWHSIGDNHTFLASDFGSWGSQKRMYSPYLFQDKEGLWHCIWSLNEEVNMFAHAASSNLYEWKRQSYPQIDDTNNFLEPEVFFDSTKNNYVISWISKSNGSEKEAFKMTTTNFKSYSKAEKMLLSNRKNERKDVVINGKKYQGIIHKVTWDLVDKLIKNEQWVKFHNSERDENLNDDPVRFSNLKPIEANITLLPEHTKSISDLLIGVFFEDINYAADGGLYAELIQNRDFEYKLSDTKNRDTTWTSTKAWYINPEAMTIVINNDTPIHKNNPNYAVIDVKKAGYGLINKGFDGIPIKKDEAYNISLFAKSYNKEIKHLNIQLKDENGTIIGQTLLKNIGNTWGKYKGVIKATQTVNNAIIEIAPNTTGKLALDMISLFPQKTYKNRPNGLRKDLAETIANLKPKFVRFPGGCVAHGDGIDNIYKWKNTIGNLEERLPQPNIWRYHQTVGLGYFEYFQFCEDINAEPLPVIAAGVPCQNSSTGGHGQQCGVSMDDMDSYIQDILDLIEWANGGVNTKWGNIRAKLGHPKPFNLKYIGIGNEDLITDVFEERFTMIFNAIKEKYPEITVIGTVGPFYMGTDYEEGWDVATKLKVPMVDEHYYQPPGWFINNQDFYDSYDRSKSKVYLGEYAAHVPNRRMNIQTALAEALYLASVERNGDVVSMTSFAPLLAKHGHTQWNPDLIYFNNTEVFPTVDYYVQQLYGNNYGETYMSSDIKLSNQDAKVKQRIASSVVKDSKTGDLILKLVNVLPVEVNSNINLNNIVANGLDATLTVLQGQPNDEHQKPVTSTIKVSNAFNYKMPAYSFSIIRFKSN